MTERTTATRWPLYWPEGWKRTPPGQQRRSAFARAYKSTLTVYSASQDVLGELARLRAGSNPVISTNLKVRGDGIPYSGQPLLKDAGAAVWFMLSGQSRVLACDKWWRVEENLRAVALHIGAIRGMERWGVGSVAQAFAGFAALPERATGPAWWDILGYDGEPENIEMLTRQEIEERFKKLAMKHHPDHGGSVETWHALQEARRQALSVKA